MSPARHNAAAADRDVVANFDLGKVKIFQSIYMYFKQDKRIGPQDEKTRNGSAVVACKLCSCSGRSA